MANLSPDPNSGAAGTEYQTIAALREAGCSVDTVWRNELTHHISHANLYTLLELPIAYRNAMWRKLKEGSYDVVHVNQPHGYLAARSLAKLCPRSVFVHRSHGFEGRVRNDMKPWISRYGTDARPSWRRALSLVVESALEYNNVRIAQWAGGHIVSASECKSFLIERYGVHAEQIAVIPQASPRAFLNRDVRAMKRERMRRILYVGQFAFFKGPVVLVAAIERVLRAVPEATFTWICDQRHHESARALFRDKNVLQRVVLLDWMNQTELVEVYDSHGLFVFPSFFEGFGKAFLEAMARGLVVVAARNGGMRDIIEDGNTGFLVSTGDYGCLADRCIRLLQQPSDVERVSSRARGAALRFSWERVAAETLGFYDRLLRQRQNRSEP